MQTTQFDISKYHITWNKEDRSFVTEASNLNLKGCPSEITLYNPKTKGTLQFSLIKVETDPENEIIGWAYSGITKKNERISLTIFND